MSILTDSQRQRVKQTFGAELKSSVQVLFFHTEEEQNQFTAATREVLSELAALSEGRLTVREVSLDQAPAEAKGYGVDKGPAMVFLDAAGRDQNIRFYGAPIGYEFMVLLEDLVDVSRGQTRLSEGARERIRAIGEDVLIQVFSTPT